MHEHLSTSVWNCSRTKWNTSFVTKHANINCNSQIVLQLLPRVNITGSTPNLGELEGKDTVAVLFSAAVMELCPWAFEQWNKTDWSVAPNMCVQCISDLKKKKNMINIICVTGNLYQLLIIIAHTLQIAMNDLISEHTARYCLCRARLAF